MIEEHFDKEVLEATEKAFVNNSNVYLPSGQDSEKDKRYIVNSFLMDVIKNLKDKGVIRVEVLHK
jgi:hypothetical protein